ncbi:hypothetical protein H0H81_012765 [Sphagnurus paluster]|uniref:F-box domain-containing protein n=1 Tax=Sphagnurus paluster TaxID=117069 RepID=A0A9P7GMZ0_9AGAR|nr:hypothetical protein H0H81_012765 [Sphagnurus paluster]
MTIAVLPQELLDYIIDHLHDDIPTLRDCSLVCHAWLCPSRTHIFHSVSLQPPKPHQLILRRMKSPTVCALSTILRSAPHLAQYVRELRIYEGMSWQAWIIQEPALVALLPQLTHVRRLHLERSAALPIPWGSLPLGLQRALTSPVLQELSIGTLSFESPEEFLGFLLGCRSLRVLQLDHLSIGAPVEVWDDVSRVERRVHLDMLVIGPRTSPRIVSCLFSPWSTIEMASLRRLSVSISSHFSEFAALLRCAKSLEELEIVLMSDVDLVAYELLRPTDRFDMSRNPRLQMLQVKFDVIQRQHDPLPWLAALLASFATTNVLAHVHVVYSVYPPDPYLYRALDSTSYARWRDVDALLAANTFGRLEKVHLEFALENPVEGTVAPVFLEVVKLDSPALRARGALVVEAFDTSR